jgi:UDP-2,3-diacylglucosamine pyrophosphatase LpxH
MPFQRRPIPSGNKRIASEDERRDDCGIIHVQTHHRTYAIEVGAAGYLVCGAWANSPGAGKPGG